MPADPLAAAWEAAVAAHEARLVVGARVRVDLGECPHVGGWHGTLEQNRTGMILATDFPALSRPDLKDTHVYLVWFDQPIRLRQSWSYAACELIPLDADSAAEDGGPE